MCFLNPTWLVFTLLFCCYCKSPQLNAIEVGIMDKTGFDIALGLELKQHTNSSLSIYNPPILSGEYEFSKDGVENSSSKQTIHAISCKIFDEDQKEDITINLNRKWNNKGYRFYYKNNYDVEKHIFSPTLIALRETDPLKIILYEGICPINYGLCVEDVQKRVAEWNKKYGIHIIGANWDSLVLCFEQLPDDISEFTKQVRQFCPDLSEKEAKQSLISQRILYLWWD